MLMNNNNNINKNSFYVNASKFNLNKMTIINYIITILYKRACFFL